jgi:hypothetical protein
MGRAKRKNGAGERTHPHAETGNPEHGVVV